MDSLLQDLRYALRMLRKTPGFTTVAALVIVLGIAAITTIFSVVNALLIKPVPGIARPHEVVNVIRSDSSRRGFGSASYALLGNLNARSHTLVGVAAFGLAHLTLSERAGEQGENAFGEYVSGNFFSLLGVQPAVGRFFLPEEDATPASHPVAVLGYGYWQRKFAGDRSIVGRGIQVNGKTLTVIGIAPREFNSTVSVLKVDVFVPTMMQPALGGDDLVTRHNSSWLQLVGRLAPRSSVAIANAELIGLGRQISRDNAGNVDDNVGLRVSPLRPLPPQGDQPVTIFMAILLAVAALVLTIASLNVASMLLARAVARQREITVRLALGAARARLVRQLLTESMLLFLIGGAGGIGVTLLAVRLLSGIQLTFEVPITFALTVDARVLAFSLVTSLVVGIVFGLVPALNASRADLAGALRSSSSGAGSRRSRTRSIFVVGQLALSLLLLTCAGLFVRALQKGRTLDPGYRIDHIATANFNLQSAGYDSARATTFFAQLVERVRAMPGVRSATMTTMLPLNTDEMAEGITVEGYHPANARDYSVVDLTAAGPGYLSTIGLPLVAGRDFTSADGPNAPAVAIVTEGFVHKFWGSSAGVGQHFKIDKTSYEIVGVTKDARFISLTNESQPFMILNANQRHTRTMNLVAKTSGDPLALATALTAVVKQLDPTLPPPRVESLESAASIALLPQHVASWVTGMMGLAGLVLAAIGLYGIVAYSVNQRTREIGVRMALGAQRRDVLGLVLRDGMRLTGIGVLVGMLLAFGATRLLASFLFGVSPFDPLTFIGVPLFFAAIAGFASFIPAKRASSIEPSVALRWDA